MGTLCELQELALSRPAATAPAPVVVAWYERKATVLEHLGLDEQAGAARRHAHRLAAKTTAQAAPLIEVA